MSLGEDKKNEKTNYVGYGVGVALCLCKKKALKKG